MAGAQLDSEGSRAPLRLGALEATLGFSPAWAAASGLLESGHNEGSLKYAFAFCRESCGVRARAWG